MNNNCSIGMTKTEQQEDSDFVVLIEMNTVVYASNYSHHGMTMLRVMLCRIRVVAMLV